MEGCDGRGHGVGRRRRRGTTQTQQQKPFVIVIMVDVSSRDTDVRSFYIPGLGDLNYLSQSRSFSGLLIQL